MKGAAAFIMCAALWVFACWVANSEWLNGVLH